MFNFSDKKKKKVVLWIVVGILVLAMVLPTAVYLISAFFPG